MKVNKLMNAMMWSNTHFPSAMRSLSPSTRAKAIEIANTMLERGETNRQQVIAASIDEARRWARRMQADAELGSLYLKPMA